jgi:hypothetical protein
MMKGRRSKCVTFELASQIERTDLYPHRFEITRKVKRTLQKSLVEHAVAERKAWAKFGQEKGNKPGPDRATTTVGENVALKISAGNKVRLYFTIG